MIRWSIDKHSKIPLYLQLEDSIKHNISLGVIKDNYQLPGVKELSAELGINIETVRKAYKELENEGLVSIGRGKKTVVTLHGISSPGAKSDLSHKVDPEEVLKSAVGMLSRKGKTRKNVQQLAGRIFNDIKKKDTKQTVIFTECNRPQLDDVSKILEDYLKMNVTPVAVNDLLNTVEKILDEKGEILSVVTTGFHINEVNEILRHIPVYVYALIIGMSSQTREALRFYVEKSRMGFICGKKESLPLHEELLHAQLGEEINLLSSVFDDKSKVEDILKSADVVLAVPEVYESVNKKAPSGKPVFNVLDYVDHMSMKLLRDKILNMI